MICSDVVKAMGYISVPGRVFLHIGVKGPPQQGTDSTINSVAVDTDGQQETNCVQYPSCWMSNLPVIEHMSTAVLPG